MSRLRIPGLTAGLLFLSAVIVFGQDSAGQRGSPRQNLVVNSTLDLTAGNSPHGFELKGDVAYGPLFDGEQNRIGHGVRLFAGEDKNGDGERSGTLTTTVTGITPQAGRWFRFRIRGLAQDGFRVDRDDLFLNVEFFRDKGQNSLDHIKKQVFELVERDRTALADRGTNRGLGRAVWRSFDLEFRTPFPDVDTLKLTVGFGHGSGRGAGSEFLIDEVELTRIPVPADYVPPAGSHVAIAKDRIAGLVPLGGRWYFDPQGGDRAPPAQFDHTNADRLLYLSDRLEAPFADNTSAWLRAGFKDREGRIVTEDKFVADNVRISFTSTHLVIRSRGLPNHPTAVFPDRWRTLDGNPNYIQEQDAAWLIPLNPVENPRHLAMQNQSNDNGALPMGPIGIAVNGVVFFNPFDHILNEDAVWRLDRCCGHPAPNALYHYHKYPVCVKSPWSDDGIGHSPLIGFAFDGFPIYGPYETAGKLAKDSTERPLNEFNVHHDDERGWHYHVTPGKFPHVIGGFWGEMEPRNGRPRPPQATGGPRPPAAKKKRPIP